MRPLAEQLGARLVLSADVTEPPSLDAAFASIDERWGRLDFVVHAIALSDKEELKGNYLDTSAANFQRSADDLLLLVHRAVPARRAADDARAAACSR